MKVKLYSTVSKKEMEMDFVSLSEFAEWIRKQAYRTFMVSWHEGMLCIGFTPIMASNDKEESVENLERDMDEAIL